MQLTKSGDRGEPVKQLQKSLNSRTSRLAPLKEDAIFGPLTKARVMEFQTDNSLIVDGIVGDKTRAKLREKTDPPLVDLFEVINELARQLEPKGRGEFRTNSLSLVSNQPVLANVLLLEGLLIVMVIFFFAALLVHSQNVANQRAGRSLQRKGQRWSERLRDDPAEAPAVKAEALEEAMKEGKALADRAKSEREKCFEKFTPEQLAKKLEECAKSLARLSTAIQSLLQKFVTRLGGGVTPENLVKGISASAGELIVALREAGSCMNCDNLLF